MQTEILRIVENTINFIADPKLVTRMEAKNFGKLKNLRTPNGYALTVSDDHDIMVVVNWLINAKVENYGYLRTDVFSNWYLVPADEIVEFDKVYETRSHKYFINQFAQYACDHPYNLKVIIED